MFIDMILASQNFHRILIVHIMISIIFIHYVHILVHMMEWKFSQISMSIILVHDLINAMIIFKKFSQTTKGWADVPNSSAAMPAATRGFTENCHLLQTEHPYRAERHSAKASYFKGDDLGMMTIVGKHYQGK